MLRVPIRDDPSSFVDVACVSAEASESVLSLLRAEMAPMHVWLRAAVLYHGAGQAAAFRRILRELKGGIEGGQFSHLPGEQVRAAQLAALNALNSEVALRFAREGGQDQSLLGEAMELLEEAENLDQHHDMSLINKSVMATISGELDAAEQWLSEIADKQRLFVPHTIASANILFAQGNVAAALSRYLAVLRKHPDCSPAVRMGIAICAYKLGQVELARSAFERVLELDPLNADALASAAILTTGVSGGGAVAQLARWQTSIERITIANSMATQNAALLKMHRSVIYNQLANHAFFKWHPTAYDVYVTKGSHVLELVPHTPRDSEDDDAADELEEEDLADLPRVNEQVRIGDEIEATVAGGEHSASQLTLHEPCPDRSWRRLSEAMRRRVGSADAKADDDDAAADDDDDDDDALSLDAEDGEDTVDDDSTDGADDDNRQGGGERKSGHQYRQRRRRRRRLGPFRLFARKLTDAEALVTQPYLQEIDPPVRADTLFIFARICHTRGQWENAAQLYESALSHNSDMPLARFGLAQLQLRAGKIAEALKILDGLQEEYPNDRDIVCMRALVRARAQERETPMRRLRDVAAGFPLEEDLWLSQAAVRQVRNDMTAIREAVQCYERVCELRRAERAPQLPAVLSNLGALLERLKEYTRAKTLYLEALACAAPRCKAKHAWRTAAEDARAAASSTPDPRLAGQVRDVCATMTTSSSVSCLWEWIDTGGFVVTGVDAENYTLQIRRHTHGSIHAANGGSTNGDSDGDDPVPPLAMLALLPAGAHVRVGDVHDGGMVCTVAAPTEQQHHQQAADVDVFHLPIVEPNAATLLRGALERSTQEEDGGQPLRLYVRAQARRLDGAAVTIAFNLANVFCELGDAQASEQLCWAVLHEHPAYVDAYVCLNKLAQRRGDLTRAAQLLEHAARTDPHSYDVAAARGHLQLRQKQYLECQKGSEIIIKSSEKRKHDPYTMMVMGALYLENLDDADKREGHLTYARRFFKRVLMDDSHNAHAANALGILCAEQDSMENARQIFNRVREATDVDCADAWSNLGHVLRRQRRDMEATNMYKTALRKHHHGHHSATEEALASLQLQNNSFADARKTFMRNLHHEPNSYRVWYNLAVALEQHAVHRAQKPQSIRTSGELLLATEDVVLAMALLMNLAAMGLAVVVREATELAESASNNPEADQEMLRANADKARRLLDVAVGLGATAVLGAEAGDALARNGLRQRDLRFEPLRASEHSQWCQETLYHQLSEQHAEQLQFERDAQEEQRRRREQREQATNARHQRRSQSLEERKRREEETQRKAAEFEKEFRKQQQDWVASDALRAGRRGKRSRDGGFREESAAGGEGSSDEENDDGTGFGAHDTDSDGDGSGGRGRAGHAAKRARGRGRQFGRTGPESESSDDDDNNDALFDASAPSAAAATETAASKTASAPEDTAPPASVKENEKGGQEAGAPTAANISTAAGAAAAAMANDDGEEVALRDEDNEDEDLF